MKFPAFIPGSRQTGDSNKTADLALALILLACSLPAVAAEVTVAVAANFTAPAREIAAAFNASTGHEARLSFGSTGQLYAQIANGAPYEVFLAADSERPRRAESNGLAVINSRFTYASGALALWSPQAGLFEDGEQYLRSGNFRRLAVANPKTAPYGAAAAEVMQKIKLDTTLEHKLVRGNSIAQTYQFVASGNAEAGFVASSQLDLDPAAADAATGSVWLVPGDYHSRIDQQAVLLQTGANNPVAAAFLAFLQSPVATRIIAGYGYQLAAVSP